MHEPNKKLHSLRIDDAWTLFLDRDGVINVHRPEDYVKTWSEFEWIDGSLEATAKLSKLFGRIVVVTNQQGVGRGIMSMEALEMIHAQMKKLVRTEGGDIHAVYAGVELSENDHKKMRKPHIGMALQAQKDFPDIDFSKSIIVGDRGLDMRFGKNARMHTVYVGTEPLSLEDALLADYSFPSLAAFAAAALIV